MYFVTLLPVIKIIFWNLFIPRYCVADIMQHISIRDENDVKAKFNSSKYINTHIASHHEDIYFMDLLENSTVFVDKTMLIKEILDTKEKVILITSPPGSGKSINLSMLKAFFEIRVQKVLPSCDQTKLVPRTLTSTYKFFTTGELNTSTDSPLQSMSRTCNVTELADMSRVATYTKPSLISSHSAIIEEHLGKYPVIYLEFDWAFFNSSNITQSLRAHICDSFIKHRFLRAKLEEMIQKIPNEVGKKKISQQLENFKFYRDSCIGEKPLSGEELEKSMLILSQVMHELFGKPVIILVDNFIAMLQYYLFEKDTYLCDDKWNVSLTSDIQLLRNFMKKTFADNSFFKKAILTGVLSVNKKDLFADISDFVHYNVINNKLQEYYGFTKSETNVLMNHFRVQTRIATSAKRFYKGYSMRPNLNLTIYNSWSIVNFLNTMHIDKYWLSREDTLNTLNRWFPSKKWTNLLESLIDEDNEEITFTDLDFNDMREMALLSSKSIFTPEETSRILSLLCEMGFLTVKFPGNFGDGDDNHIMVRITNDESRRALKRIAES